MTAGQSEGGKLRGLGYSKFLLIGLLALTLSACGFHLKGTGGVGALPFERIHLAQMQSVHPQVKRALQSQLKRSGVTIADSLSAAQVQLVMSTTAYQATRTATSGLGDTSAELLKMSQGFSLLKVEDESIVVSGTATVYRDRQINTAAMVAADRELSLLQREMAEEVARQILDRIQRAYRQPQTAQSLTTESAKAAQ